MENRKKKSFLPAAALTLAFLCGCNRTEVPPSPPAVKNEESTVYTSVSEPETAASSVTSEAETATSPISSETSKTETSVTEVSETTASEVSQTTVSLSEALPAETEIITEASSYSELINSSFTETVAASQAVSNYTEETASTEAVVIPEIYSGNFSGEKVLENELARVDISDTENGIIKITYSGSCEKLKVRITKDGSIYDYTLDGNGTVYPLQSGSGEYNVKILENVSGKTYAIALDESFTAEISDSFRPYLMPTQYINYGNGDECVEKAAVLSAGCKSDFEKISKMFVYVTDSISYDKELAANVKSGYIPDPDRTLENGTGICFDYASLFAAMCRSQSIPTKLVMGYVQGNVYHAWNEVYTDQTGWITVDLFLDSKGWELLDPTFYASADDKSSAAEYMSDKNAYSAVYYY